MTPREANEVYELIYRPYTVAITTAEEVYRDLSRMLYTDGPLRIRSTRHSAVRAGFFVDGAVPP